MGAGNFTADFKRDAVAQITERVYPAKEVSAQLDASTHSLYAWKRKLAKAVAGDTEKDAEIRRLKRELVRVPEERDILKRNRVFRQGRKVRYAFVAEHRGQFSGVGDVPVPAYLADRVVRVAEDTTEPAGAGRQTPDRNAAEGLAESGKVYGYRKRHDDLVEQGESICPNRVSRLTQLAGIKAQIGYKRCWSM